MVKGVKHKMYCICVISLILLHDLDAYVHACSICRIIVQRMNERKMKEYTFLQTINYYPCSQRKSTKIQLEIFIVLFYFMHVVQFNQPIPSLYLEIVYSLITMFIELLDNKRKNDVIEWLTPHSSIQLILYLRCRIRDSNQSHYLLFLHDNI